ELFKQGSHHRIEEVQRARALGCLVFVAPAKRQRRTFGDGWMQEEVTGPKARGGAVRVIHYRKGAVLRATGSYGVPPMVVHAKEAALPQVALPARKSRGAAAGEPGLELALVDTGLQETLGNGPAGATEPLGMEMEPDPGMRTDALYRVVVDALV